MSFVIGVDGGGTHARAVIVDAEGRDLGRGEAPGAVVTVRSPAEAAEAVELAVREAAASACVDLPGAVLWAGLSGAGQEDARRAELAELTRVGLADHVVVGTDVEAAFRSAFPRGPGVLLIAGTGSIAWGRDAEGRVVRVGGWGERLGDEGGGYAVGLAALRAVARAEDGRAEPTAMRAAILEALGLSDPEQLIPWATLATKAEMASLVPIVAEIAATGDPAANALLDEAVAELVRHVAALLRRIGGSGERARLALWGGAIGREGSLRSRLLEALATQPVDLIEADPDAAMGAALLALSVHRGGPPKDV